MVANVAIVNKVVNRGIGKIVKDAIEASKMKVLKRDDESAGMMAWVCVVVVKLISLVASVANE